MRLGLVLSSLLIVTFEVTADDFLTSLPKYIENTSVFEEGQEPPRAYHIPHDHISLNGEWKFKYSETVTGYPKAFYSEEFDDSGWDFITVPSNWEMQGYGDKMFRNVAASFSLKLPEGMPANPYLAPPRDNKFVVAPPNVPYEYNPTGAYRKTFTLPDDWKQQEVFLRFEKVASASFVWVNGHKIGYNEGAHEPSEYKITDYIKAGENTISVLVTKFSDGYYLEGQDYWRLAGIFDDTWLYATPKQRIFDWQVTTDLDENYVDASLNLVVDIKNYSNTTRKQFKLQTSLLREGNIVMENTSEPFSIENHDTTRIALSKYISSPLKWNEHTPNLYGLKFTLLDEENAVVDSVDTRIGFKETQIIGNTFYLNGVPIKLNAMNSHMQHPDTGHTVSEADIRSDLEMLKRFNFNAIRISHYPPDPQYLEIADELGIYVIDEAGTEAHQSEYLSNLSDYVSMYEDRVRKMVIRDRNFASVLFWSAGNESGEGPNITKVVEEGKRLDPSRYWMYGGNLDKHPAEDIIGPRYPSPVELEAKLGLDTEGKRPSFMDEYLSVAGNGGGAMDNYWRVIYNHPRVMGGALWDYISVGVTEQARAIQDTSPYNTPVHLMGNAKLTEGRQGKGVDLNGHDQWVEVYRADNVEINANQLTLSVDIYPRALSSSGGAIITKGDNQFGIQQIGEEQLQFYIYTDKKYTLTVPLPKAWENQWHNLRAVYDGSSLAMYINGQKSGELDAKGEIKNYTFPVNIGRNAQVHGQDTDVYISDAVIDNVAIFDKALPPGEPLLAENAKLWLEFESETNEGKYFSYGIGARTYGAVWPNRIPQPEMQQFKKSVQPLEFKLISEKDGLVEVWNRSNFANANTWQTKWAVTQDDKTVQSGVLELDVPAQSKKLIEIPIKARRLKAGKEYRILITSTLKSTTPWASKGYQVAWSQLELPGWFKPLPAQKAPRGELSVTQGELQITVEGEDFKYAFNAQSGALESAVIDGKQVLASPLQLNVWRAPLANELDAWNSNALRSKRWDEGYGAMVATDYYSAGIHNLKFAPISVDVLSFNNTAKVSVVEQALTHGGAKKFSMLDRYIKGLTIAGFESRYDYTITSDGVISLKHKVIPMGPLPQMLPRVGVTLKLEKDFDQVNWYGRGPEENYPDRKSGYPIGIYRSTVADMYEPYLIPQDNGLRSDTRWLKVTNSEGAGLQFSMDELFNFNTSPYSTDNLTKANYTFQLKPADFITLNLDYKTTGVGGTARAVYEGYRTYPQEYERTIVIKPVFQ
ncbi:beta-galactosidase (plasmid) [Alteromonas sp. I4]|nr:beta-galactosidase [Alteromonas sp. I4]